MNAPDDIAPEQVVPLRHGLYAILLGHTDVDRPDGSVDPEVARARRRQASAARSRRQFAEARRRDPEAFL